MQTISGNVGSCLWVTVSTVVVGLATVLSGVLSTQTCSPHTVTSRHNVHAYSEHPGQCLSGCVSAVPTTANTECEFHVVNLRSSSPSPAPSSSTSQFGAGTDSVNLVDFYFKPKLPGIFSRSLVLVLNSPTATHWRLEGDGMFSLPVYTIKVVVPEHSCGSVTYDSDISLAVRVICTSLPQNNSDLLSFVQEQYGSVASFNEVVHANSLTLLVGSDIVTPTTCQLQPNFQTYDFSAKHILEHPITGCSLYHPGPLKPEFHIILLREPVGTSDVVTVELRPAGSCVTACDIILVVVSEANVTWRITGGQRSGTLQILSPNNVDVDPRRELLVENHDLPRNTADLMEWAGTQQWPLGSFTSADTANKFVVTIDNNGGPTKEPPSRLSFIKQYTEKECHREFIQVRILRRVMVVFQLNADNMMLRDHTCRAVESGDYYIIDTQRDQCGTTVTETDTGLTVYHNEVIFSTSESVLEGSGGSDLEKLMGGTPVDDEQSSTARVPFTCTYDVSGDVLPDGWFSPFGPQLTLSMNMYTGNQFAQKQLMFPHKLQAGERVYFEVALTDGQRLSIVPSQCWLSTGLKMLTSQLHMLIYNSCARDESLIFHRDISHSSQAVRFSFEVPDLQWDNMYYMHCELGICSDDGAGVSNGIPLCGDIMDPETSCLVINKHNGLVVDFPTKSLYLGPFEFLPLNPVALNEDGIDSGPGYERPQVSKESNDCKAVGLATGPAAAIALASFVMGLVLMGALWFIHTHTGPHTGPPPSASPCTVSTASSPSANGHLMNGHIPNGAVPNGVVPNGVVPNGNLPRGFMASSLNPNRIPLQGMRHVDPLPEDV